MKREDNYNISRGVKFQVSPFIQLDVYGAYLSVHESSRSLNRFFVLPAIFRLFRAQHCEDLSKAAPKLPMTLTTTDFSRCADSREDDKPHYGWVARKPVKLTRQLAIDAPKVKAQQKRRRDAGRRSPTRSHDVGCPVAISPVTPEIRLTHR